MPTVPDAWSRSLFSLHARLGDGPATYRTNIAADDDALQDAWTKASARASYGYFDQHIIWIDDGCGWVAEGVRYEALLDYIAERIIATIPTGRSDEN